MKVLMANVAYLYQTSKSEEALTTLTDKSLDGLQTYVERKQVEWDRGGY